MTMGNATTNNSFFIQCRNANSILSFHHFCRQPGFYRALPAQGLNLRTVRAVDGHVMTYPQPT